MTAATTTPRARPCGRARRRAVAGLLGGLVLGLLAGTVGVPPGPAAATDDDDPPVQDQRATAATAPAAMGPAAPLSLPAPGLPGLPRTSVALATIEVDSPAFRRATELYQDADAAHATARGVRHGIDAETSVLDGVTRRLTATHRSASARRAAAERRLGVIEGAIQDLVIGQYVDGAGADRVTAALADGSPSVNDAERRAVLAAATLETLLAEREHLVAVAEVATGEARAAVDELDRIRDHVEGLAAARPAAQADEVARGGDLARQRVAYEEARVLAGVRGVDFPLVALDAYHRAAERVADELPSCGLRWWALAGVSRVEGRHGTYGGSSLTATGQTTRRIIGIPLDGTNDTLAIPDTDGGALDGDPVWDRAVGPMQFIPGTWRRFAADGTGNGVADPHNLYDASLAAARYLCRSSGGLGGDDGLRRAFLAYNRSEAYVERVLGLARGYERTVEVPEPRS